MVTYREGIAIVQVVFYVLALTGGIFLSLRHGFSRASGWVLLITFSLLRLIGAVLEIVGINHPSRQVITGAIVCISIGLSPLTLMCLSLMSRVNRLVGEPIPHLVYRIINLGGLAALCLGIYGGTQQAKSNSTNPADYTDVNHFSKIAVILFTIIYIMALVMYLVLLLRLSDVPQGEKRILLAIGLSWPFLAVRYIYALVADFAHNKNFNSFFGSPTLYLIMAVLMEFIVVIICEATGFTLRVLPKHDAVPTSDSEMNTGYAPGLPVNGYPNTGNAYPKVGNPYYGQQSAQVDTNVSYSQDHPKRRARGPISWLYFQAKDAMQSRN